MRPTLSTLTWLVTTALIVTLSQAAPIVNRASSREVEKRWLGTDTAPSHALRPPSSFLSHDGHVVFDDDDDDAGNEMLDTEEQLLRPDADDEIEGTIEGQVLEVEEDDDELDLDVSDTNDDEDPLTDADLEAINQAYMETEDLYYQQQPQHQYQQQQQQQQEPSSPSPVAAIKEQKAPFLVRPVVMVRFDGARTRSRALK